MDIKTKMNLMDIGFRMRRLSDEELRKSLDRISRKVMSRVVESRGAVDETPTRLEDLEF